MKEKKENTYDKNDKKKLCFHTLYIISLNRQLFSMRYTHNIKIIRRRKHAFKISFVFTLFILILIGILGFTLLDAKQFFLGFFESLLRVSLSYTITLFLAIGITLFVTASSTIEAFSLPILDVLQSFPSFALFPLFVVWFGRTSVVPVAILIITMIWPMIFTLITAQKQIRQDLLDAAKIYRASGNKFFLFVLFPLLFPAIITGSLIAWGEAWEAIIAAEIIVSVPGVGTYLAAAGTEHHTSILIIGILLLLLILFLINKYLWLSLLNISTKNQQE